MNVVDLISPRQITTHVSNLQLDFRDLDKDLIINVSYLLRWPIQHYNLLNEKQKCTGPYNKLEGEQGPANESTERLK